MNAVHCAQIHSALVTVLIFAASAAGQDPLPQKPDMGPAVIAPDIEYEYPVRDDLDTYGGWTKLKGKATGFFHVEYLGNRWWFITPEGNAYFMLELGWADRPEQAPRLKSWGFNAAEERSGMPYTILLGMFRQEAKPFPVAQQPGYPPWVSFVDVFDPDWAKRCEDHARSRLAALAQDPLMIGYFLDNEVCYTGWYEAVFAAPKDAPCRKAFVEVARAYYARHPGQLEQDWKAFGVSKVDDLLNLDGPPANIPNLSAAWQTAVAERAFSVTAGAAKAADPNHLNLGTRLFNAPLPSPGVLGAMGKYCDVISMNLYSMMPDRLLTQMFTLVPAIHLLTGRPTMTTEFSFRAGDTLHPNTMGALPAVKTQAERGIGYLSYVSAVASMPNHIGVSWYKYADDNPKASWEGYAEDCNFGVVDGDDRPYAVLSQAMRATNTVIYDLAAEPVRNNECPLFWRTQLTRWDCPGDEILLQQMTRSDSPFIDPLTAALPEPRRYHDRYWIHHEGPSLTVNDNRFTGWCQANLAKRGDDGTTLVLLNVQAYASLPRSLWLGDKCDRPDAPFALESNAQFLLRKIDPAGRLLRLTMADGSFVRTEYANSELRTEGRVPYLDLRLNPDTQRLQITTRGTVKHLGVAGVKGWTVSWNGVALADSGVPDTEGMTVFTSPE